MFYNEKISGSLSFKNPNILLVLNRENEAPLAGRLKPAKNLVLPQTLATLVRGDELRVPLTILAHMKGTRDGCATSGGKAVGHASSRN